MDFQGEYTVTVDPKGRFLLPGGFKKQFPEGESMKFMLCKGFENCISMYTQAAWTVEFEKLKKIDDRIPANRAYKRVKLSGTTEAIPDSNDRVLLPKTLLEKAGITKDMTMLCLGDKIELWDKDRYDKYIDEMGESDTFSKLAETVEQREE